MSTKDKTTLISKHYFRWDHVWLMTRLNFSHTGTYMHTDSRTFTHTHARTHAHTCTPYPKSPWLLKTPPLRPQQQLNGTTSEDDVAVSSRVSCSWELMQTAWGPCPCGDEGGGRRLAPPTSEKVSSCQTQSALVCRELNSHQKWWVKSFKLF